MPTLHGTLPDEPGPTSPCRWCGAPTDLAFAPEGSRIGPVPLHILCGAAFIRASMQLKAGRKLKPRDQARLEGMLAPQLGEGHAANSTDALQR